MAITTLDQLTAALAASKKYGFLKSSVSNTVAGQLHSLWRATGGPIQPSAPTTAETPTDDTVGSFALPTPGGANKLYIARFGAACSIPGFINICDRLGHMGGLSGTVITPTDQTVGVTLTTAAAAGRCAADGSDVQWFLEWYTDTGSGAPVITVNYVGNDDVAGVATQTLPATVRASRLLPIFPTPPHTSIKSVTSIVLSVTTGTAGNFGVTALKRITSLPLSVSGVGVVNDFAAIGLPEIKPTACLQLDLMAANTTTGILCGSFDVVEG